MDENTVMDTLEQAREFFDADRFAVENGMTIELAERRHSVVRLELNSSHKNATGNVQGGVMFTMSDFAAAVASNFGTGTGLHVSTDANISFVGAAKGSVLTAEAVCVKGGRSLEFYEVNVHDDFGNLITTGRFTTYRVK